MIRPGPLEIGLILVVVIFIAGVITVIVLLTRRAPDKQSSYDQLKYEQLYLKEGKIYCRNCGKELVGSPELCMNCGARPLAGTSFCLACGGATNPLSEICVKCGARVAKVGMVSPKSRLAVTLLSFFLGELGIHRFYLGKIGTGIAMLLTLGGLGIWSLIDFIIAVSGNMKDKEGRLIEKW
jgi:hypothetical protein